jgi:antibiotic biosynthesis monooxygenase (ABM) superfamily enzyme
MTVMPTQRADPAVLTEDDKPRRMVIADQAELASAIITESIPPGRRRDYLRWVEGINRAAESFPGYRETNVFPPLRPDGQEWITIIHFQSRADLENWLDSDVRAGWVDRFRREFGDFTLHAVHGGLASWFAGQHVPAWKMVLTVLLALYPTVMMITLVIVPRLKGLPPALSMLIGNVLSVSILQWILMPPLNRLLAPWLKPATLIERRSHVVGTLAVIGAILGLFLLFLAFGAGA